MYEFVCEFLGFSERIFSFKPGSDSGPLKRFRQAKNKLDYYKFWFIMQDDYLVWRPANLLFLRINNNKSLYLEFFLYKWLKLMFSVLSFIMNLEH